MFRPVGDLPPSVYWRRRFALLGSVVALIVLIALTIGVLASNSGNAAKSTAGGSTSSTPPPTPSVAVSSTTPVSSTSSGAGSATITGSTSGSASGSASAPPAACAAGQLSLSAASDKTGYAVGDQPVVSILVENTSSQPCVQDLADPQIVLRVYNGESRVWGSHDCKIEPGTDDRTLVGGAIVRISVVWSGLSSQPGCTGPRQRAGAGTYTLYASLGGHEGKAAQFTIG